MKLVLYQPEIAANVGASIRNCACFGATLDVIEPCGFPVKMQAFRRVALDYTEIAPPTFHRDWDYFTKSDSRNSSRLILLSTKAQTAYYDQELFETDAFLIGQESAGVPDLVVEQCDLALRVPMMPAARSLNMAVTSAVVLAEARRQFAHRAT
ncbi:MAG: TrmH family RNA methyltransferase [bacterium]